MLGAHGGALLLSFITGHTAHYVKKNTIQHTFGTGASFLMCLASSSINQSGRLSSLKEYRFHPPSIRFRLILQEVTISVPRASPSSSSFILRFRDGGAMNMKIFFTQNVANTDQMNTSSVGTFCLNTIYYSVHNEAKRECSLHFKFLNKICKFIKVIVLYEQLPGYK
jgi:hypothetical protein